MKSIIYLHPAIYSLFMRFSYKGGYVQRYETIRDLIKENSSVVDVCCGDCEIFHFLKAKGIRYLGLDFNSYFVKVANKKGINAEVFNIYRDEIPQADYILLMGSLYQFIPGQDEIIKKLFNAANKYLIISEAVRNYAESKSRVVSFVSKMLNNPGDGIKAHRFNINTFREAIGPFQRNIVKEFSATNNTDYIAVFKRNGESI